MAVAAILGLSLCCVIKHNAEGWRYRSGPGYYTATTHRARDRERERERGRRKRMRLTDREKGRIERHKKRIREGESETDAQFVEEEERGKRQIGRKGKTEG